MTLSPRISPTLRYGLVACAAVVLVAALAEEPPDAPELPAAVDREVSFDEDVRPLLQEHCLHCHGGGKSKGGFRIDDREAVLKGGESGPAVVLGKSAASPLIHLVAGVDPEAVMPEDFDDGGRRLTAAEIAVLRSWIDQGLSWKAGFSFSPSRSRRPNRGPKPAIAPRRPQLPPGPADENPIDRILRPYFEAHGVELRSVGDLVFARRAFFDTIGLAPTPRQLDDFVNDARADRRERLVRALLARRSSYASHWMTFWNDTLRNDYKGTGYIDGGRKQITDWLYRALQRNIPYDRFVRELIAPVSGSEGFIKGIVWRGVVNASQTPEMQAAQNVSQIFLGVNLKCASCHDSFINSWKLKDAYGLAAVFAEKPLPVHRCNKPTGAQAEVAFLFPELGTIDAAAPRTERLGKLAEIITGDGNGLFTRTFVNRLWARFFGRGLVEPVDDMEQPAWNRDLLDWLAEDFRQGGYDIHKTIERILTSRAYQMPAVGALEREEGEYTFRGPHVRRLEAEPFCDALSQLTGVWPKQPVTFFRSTLIDSPSKSSAKEPNVPVDDHEASRHQFVRYASGVVKTGYVEIDVDIRGARSLWLVVGEGEKGRNHDWATWGEPHLVAEDGTTKRLTEMKWRSATTGHKKVQIDKNCVGKPLRLHGKKPEYGLGTHAVSIIVYDLPSGHSRFRALAGPDGQAVEESPDAGHEIEFIVMTDVHVRSVMSNRDVLTGALGRPNREQVITRRASVATTLQALELTNGETLSKWLRQGAEAWLTREPNLTAEQFVEKVYRQALCRSPTVGERETASALLGTPPTREGLEDLFWVIAMLPEFQLIY